LTVLLEEYIGSHRSKLLNGQDPQTLFTSSRGKSLCQGGMYALVCDLTMRHVGKKVSPHVFRDIFAYHWLEQHPEDYLTLSKILWHTNIQTTLQTYGAQYNESNGVARLDDLLEDRELTSRVI
jgi:site-specific recombinase XerD